MRPTVIFDFDGVIIDSERSQCKLFRDELLRQGYDHDHLKDSDLIGKTTEQIIAEHYPQMPREDLVAIMNRLRQGALHNAGFSLIPHAHTIITALYNAGVQLAITSASNSAHIQKQLIKHGLNDYFSTITGSDHVRRSKPDPQGYKLTMKQLGVRPEETIVIEDSPAGVEAAKRAGATVYAILTSMQHEHQLPGADKYFNSHLEILDSVLGKKKESFLP